MVNTGRPFGHLNPLVKELGFKNYICACGMFIMVDQQIVIDKKPDYTLCKKIRDLVVACKLDAVFEAYDGGYYINNFSESISREKETLRKSSIELNENVYDEDFHFDKFVVWENQNSDFDRFSYEARKHFLLIRRGEDFTELVLKGYSKGKGIQRFLSAIKKTDKIVFAFGDSTNDTQMFANADISILMGDGDPALAVKVTFVTKPVDEDGILYGLKKFGLIT